MRVAIVYQYYQGRDAPGHSLVYELSHYLAAQGHHVTVIAGETGYMKRDAPRLPWFKRFIRRERDGSVDVIRTYTYTNLHTSYVTRMLSFLSFTASCPFGLLAAGKADVVLASSPPLFPVFSAWLIARARRIPFVTEVRDLWPASALQMGLLREGWVSRCMAWMERRLYDRSAKIVALTEGIRDDICSRGWPAEKVEVVTCGVDTSVLFPDQGAGRRMRVQNGWEDKKVVLYFGALGEANNIAVTVRAAARLRDRHDILFVLVGDGMYRRTTEEQRVSMKLENLHILPPVPKEEARAYINAADVCLVTLRDIPLFRGAIPTKLIDYMACGKPVLCGVRGEAERLVEEAGAGAIFDADDDLRLSRLIIDMVEDSTRAARFGEQGAAFVRQRFDAQQMRQHMESILRDAVRCGAEGGRARSKEA